MTALEAVEGARYDLVEIESALTEVMEWHSRFYMHTDERALGELSARLLEDGQFADVLGLDDIKRVANFVRHPHRHHRTRLASHLLKPEIVGCGHLAGMLRHPDRYGVRRGLVEDAILSFYRRMWHGSPAPNFVVLSDQHQEKAVLDVKVDAPVRASTFVPSLRVGVLGESSAFVVHEIARRFLRRENLLLLVSSAAIHPGTDVDAVLDEMEALSRRQLEATIELLAADLPVWEVRFGAHGEDPTFTRI